MRLGLLTGVTILALVGCNSNPAEAPPVNMANAAAETETNVAAEANATTPAPAEGELLAGIPTYPNVEGEGARMAGSSPQGTGGMQTFSTHDSAGWVATFYGEAAERAGFTIANRTDMGHTAAVTARRGQGELLNVTATRVGAVTEVQIIASRGPQ